ncbi:NLP/P60 hydrolase [Phaeobacter gallaeciensis]|uniref:NLP/P60 hydrolase n=1 Tax=Phaeobacter gallaeciensis TaxID=60890 RepID=A0A366WWM1_9RHOB|nr:MULTISPECIES: NlpC/P60 family protein [Roseobacteraceae]MBT8168613.1 C40 family peptidase [Falsiruegeria litorea]RBW53916.1 NLP/P60 hydrolase [Phaeobacter gallaeciensis]
MQHQIHSPVVNLLRRPNGPRDRQLLAGDSVQILETNAGWSHICADKDAYVGFVRAEALGPYKEATHWVSTLATHAYAQANIKSPDQLSLSFGSRITAISTEGGFVETEFGYIPQSHLSEIGVLLTDPVEVAAKFLGTPYLWGGNSRMGLDCSGLVQAALLACGYACPGDSGDQEQNVGTLLDPGTPPRRGDLLFWKGHVAWVADANTLLHANAYHMAVCYEPLDSAIERIQSQGDGPVTAHKRP